MNLNKIKDILDSKDNSQNWLTKKLGKSFGAVNRPARK